VGGVHGHLEGPNRQNMERCSAGVRSSSSARPVIHGYLGQASTRSHLGMPMPM
jgi:hypothetical protein